MIERFEPLMELFASLSFVVEAEKAAEEFQSIKDETF